MQVKLQLLSVCSTTVARQPPLEVISNLDVDEGTTVTDYMTQERQRGITIRAAAITFNWHDFTYNLVDTPGHVDFSGEVYRVLTVLDGAVMIIDGVDGVRAQSEAVWRNSNHIPKIIFINKLDLGGANIETPILDI